MFDCYANVILNTPSIQQTATGQVQYLRLASFNCHVAFKKGTYPENVCIFLLSYQLSSSFFDSVSIFSCPYNWTLCV